MGWRDTRYAHAQSVTNGYFKLGARAVLCGLVARAVARLVRVGALLQLRAAVISCSHARIGDKTIEGRGCGTIGVINKVLVMACIRSSGAV